MSRNVRQRTFRHVRPVKIQISLRIRAVWSETSLGALWIVNDARIVHEDNEDSDQTIRLMCVFIGRTCQKARVFTSLRFFIFYVFFVSTGNPFFFTFISRCGPYICESPHAKTKYADRECSVQHKSGQGICNPPIERLEIAKYMSTYSKGPWWNRDWTHRFWGRHSGQAYITKTRLFKYIENFTSKKLKIFR